MGATFDALQDRLGEPQPEDEAALLSAEAGEDMVALLFETEVDSILSRLDEVLGDPDLPCLKSEFAIAAQELGGLGEMLDLPTFCSLCEDIALQLGAAREDRLVFIATQAQQAWRKAQSLVTIGQRDLIPATLGLGTVPAALAVSESAPAIAEDASPFSELDADWDALDLEDLEATAPVDEFEFATALQSAETSDLSDEIAPFTELEAVLETPDEIESEPTSDLEDLWVASDETTTPSALVADLVETIPTAARPTAVAKSVKTTVNAIAASPDRLQEFQDLEADQTVRVSSQHLNQMGELLGELLIERSGLTLQLKRLRELTGLLTQRLDNLENSNVRLRNTSDKVVTQASGLSRPTGVAQSSADSDARPLPHQSAADGISVFSSVGNGAGSTLTQGFDALEMDRYSELHSLSQELMENAVQIEEVTTDINTHLDDAEQTARSLSRTAKKLQVGMTQMRMRPISEILGRFPRTLRELCLQHNKAVELKISGSSTLVDRIVLETLSDPLIHLLRNAFDHGIEDAQTRIAQGKPAQGLIAINAAYRGNQIVITLRDDGSGIDLEKVKAKAARMGLDSATLDTASPSELLDLIFEPGFSTAEQVSDLSGRGVGMDIVRTNLQKIKGSITVDTQLGQGTTFTLTVPFNLSMIRVLLVESNGSLMAFPTDSVEEMLLLESQNLVSLNGRTTLNLDGTEVSFVQLQDWLKFPRTGSLQADIESSPKIDQPCVLLIDRGEQVVGIEVDRYWGEQEVTVRQVAGAIALPSAFAGCTVLGDGRIVPLVDPFSLLQYIDAQAIDAQAETSEISAIAQVPIAAEVAAIAPTQPTVMVVDDSVNVRRFLALTLEKAGFRVEQAKDGQHALEQVRSCLSIQAVICDLEMPRLDGFGFLANIKVMPTAQDIPVVMLTSRSGDKLRKLALSLGASDYFSKPFREEKLLETIHQLIATTA